MFTTKNTFEICQLKTEEKNENRISLFCIFFVTGQNGNKYLYDAKKSEHMV